MTDHWTARLPKDSCDDAVAWAGGYATAEAAWEACERGDWMAWLIARTEDRRRVVLALCDCARLAIEMAEGWTRGESSLQNVRAAAATTADTAAAAADVLAAMTTARTDTLKLCADIIRRYFPAPPVLAAVETARETA